ncbi:hypothetical protein [Mycolicibacterium fortuitum]|uniref:Uncharacterized protein n=1 Tax=Mycolicibacterium fortuitum TaxID=1766 RepID=A0AAE4V8E8_MYCFO|nr:hypothetical protein [Mycolicibacterium fortuitum]MDV7194612.1 hypothetical protein [Mycolicibacterium fortuitum]MDV7208612.1 hypothetical protein [Mycolicibacterium fortuitum]MDV7230509.1 hypothetical protein [Mycolicibacterium fortuitum]MDV7261884.1 hypothetical protein [Mycolicibacterium fortuitum]MDV7287007.1 hypothetical protein [Mycolicibacterium fortuitum]
MSYIVDAPLVLARDQEGKVHHCYQGAVIPWLPADLAAHLLELGMVRKVSASEPAEEPKGESDEASGQPLRAAPKADWVDFAVSKGADRDEAEALNKQELIDLYG